MESNNPARRSSGVYDIAYDQRSFGSGDELRGVWLCASF